MATGKDSQVSKLFKIKFLLKLPLEFKKTRTIIRCTYLLSKYLRVFSAQGILPDLECTKFQFSWSSCLWENILMGGHNRSQKLLSQK